MLTHSYYEEDARVRREAETLVRHGRPVDVFALRRPGESATTVIDGVTVRRLGVSRHQGAGLPRYLAEYLDFFVRAMVSATAAHRRRRYALVEVHTLPDFLVFAGTALRLAGVPVLLDLHEAMPEFFRMRFPGATSRPALAALRLQERLSIAAATAVLTVNDALRDRLLEAGVRPDKVTVILNTPDLAIFDASAHPRRPFMADGTLRLVYAGAVTPTYELDVAIGAVAALRAARPALAVVFDVYGRGDAQSVLDAQVSRAGLGDAVRFHGRIPLEDVPAAIARADIGLAPTRRTDMTDFSLSTKLFECAAMGKPVVASALPTVERYFDRSTVARYAPGSSDDLAAAILSLVDDESLREARIAATAARLVELGWDREAARYRAVVDRLAGSGTAAPAPNEAAS